MLERLQDLRNIQKGQTVVYHTGFLAVDRKKNVVVAKIAAEAYELYVAGRVSLVQKRTAPALYEGGTDVQRGYGTFEYLAVGI